MIIGAFLALIVVGVGAGIWWNRHLGEKVAYYKELFEVAAHLCELVVDPVTDEDKANVQSNGVLLALALSDPDGPDAVALVDGTYD